MQSALGYEASLELQRQAELARQAAASSVGPPMYTSMPPAPPMSPSAGGSYESGAPSAMGSASLDLAQPPAYPSYEGPPEPAGAARASPRGSPEAINILEPVDPRFQPPESRFTDPMSGAVMPKLRQPVSGGFGDVLAEVYNPKPVMPEGPPMESGGAFTTSSSALAATVPKPETKLEAGGALKKRHETEDFRGAAGVPRAATTGRRTEDIPPVTEKAVISPRYLQELEQSDPTLHDNIVQAATAAGIGSWKLANLVYAYSKGDPSFKGDGRVGLTGLTEADIARYRKERPELFRDAQGNPVEATDPHTNLILGALKYREAMDLYGSDTPSAAATYRVGPGRVSELANLTGPQQRQHLSDDDRAAVRETIDPYAAPGSASQALKLTPMGSTTAAGAAQAAVASVRAGNPRIFATYMAENLPRGMSANDGWRHVEALMVGAMVAKGDMAGVQHARELVFQMSHVGAAQSLMNADKMMQANDLYGAAQELARAYYFAPDGGVAKFHVTSNGIYGQRYNEATKQPIGGPFKMDREKIMGLINMTSDPHTYSKTMREAQKLNADIEKSHAEAEHKKAETKDIPLKRATEDAKAGAEIRKSGSEVSKIEAEADYYRQRPELEQYRSDNALTAKLLDIHAKLARNPGDAKADEELRKHLDSIQPRFFPEKDTLDQPIPLTEERTKQTQLWRHMLMINRNLSPDRAADIAGKLTGGQLGLGRTQDGHAAVTSKPGPEGKPIGVLLPPSTFQLLLAKPLAATPTSPIGSSSAPPT